MESSRMTAIGILWAVTLVLVICRPLPVWSQPAPVVVQVPNGATAAPPRAMQKGSTYFQTAGAVSLENGEGAITATLGDLLRETDGAGLERVHITGRARGVSGAGTNIGQVTWTAVSIDDEGEKKTAPLASPLTSQFRLTGKTIAAGTKIKAKGDLASVISAARSLMQKPKKAEAKDDKSAAKPVTAAPTASGSQGASNDIARNYAPAPAVATAAPAATPAPPEPTLTLTSNGCSPRVDAPAGFVVIQSQTLSNGAPTAQGCTDTAERIPIQKSYASCPDLVQGDVAQPQYKQFWVATNGTTNFISDCTPDPDTKYTITSDTTGCQASANLTTLSWDIYAQRIYLNHDNQKVVVSACAISTSTALQLGKDYAACPVQVDLTKGLADPEYKAWYLNPATKQQQAYTDCQPDPLAAAAIQKDYAACPAIVGATAAQRQYQNWYADATGQRINYGTCTTDLDSSMVIQTTSTGCSDFVDQSKLTAWGQVRSFYYDATGTAVPVKDCAPDPAQAHPLQADYSVCPATVNEAAGFAEDIYKLFYVNATGRVDIGQCTPDPNRLYVIKDDFTSCADEVDLPNLVAYAQFTTYYLDVAGVKHPVNQQCQPQPDAFKINTDISVCPYALDMSQHTAQEQGQLYYLDRLSARIMVRDCAPTATPPITVTSNMAACALRADYTNLIAVQQEAWQYVDTKGTIQNVTSCTDSTITYPITPIYGVCPDLVLSDKSAAFKQVRMQVTTLTGPQYLTDCEPSQTSGDEATPSTTVTGCETTFFTYISQGQSFGSWRYYYQFTGSAPVYLTACLQSTTAYPIQSEIQGYAYNDPQKTAQPKTALYIMPPAGRVDISAAQVRDGAANIAYTFVRTTNNARGDAMYWVGCEGDQPTDQTETYARPDLTQVSYVVGAGPTVDMGDQCTRTTQYQTIYAYASVDSYGYVYGPGVPGGVLVATGTVNYGQLTSCQAINQNATMTVTNFAQQQVRTVTTLPAGAGGTSTYGVWASSGGPYANGSAVCYGPVPDGSH
jgi:hypothetical protein